MYLSHYPLLYSKVCLHEIFDLCFFFIINSTHLVPNSYPKLVSNINPNPCGWGRI